MEDIRIKGPINYITFPLTCTVTGKIRILHLFSDFHEISTTCREQALFLHELIDNTLDHYQRTEPDHIIDIFCEVGFGEIDHITESMDKESNNYLRLFKNYYSSRGCFYNPNQIQCKRVYPNTRFHNTDFRVTLFNLVDQIRKEFGEPIYSSSEYNTIVRKLDPLIQFQSGLLPPENKNQMKELLLDQPFALNINTILRSVLTRINRIKEHIKKLNQFIMSGLYTKEQCDLLKSYIEFYDWGIYMLNILDKRWEVKINLDMISDELPTANIMFNNRLTCFYMFYLLRASCAADTIIVGDDCILEKHFVESVKHTTFIYNRFQRMIDKLEPAILASILGYFQRKWTVFKNSRYNKFSSDFFMDMYTFLRIIGNFRDGTSVDRIVMYGGLAHIKELLVVFRECGIFQLPVNNYIETLNYIYRTIIRNQIINQCISIPVMRYEGGVYLPFSREHMHMSRQPSKSVLINELPKFRVNPMESTMSKAMDKRGSFVNETSIRFDSQKANAFKVGDYVEIHGILSKPILNNKIGQIIKEIPEKTRWGVRINIGQDPVIDNTEYELNPFNLTKIMGKNLYIIQKEQLHMSRQRELGLGNEVSDAEWTKGRKRKTAKKSHRRVTLI